MKPSYTSADIEIISLGTPDIITASGGNTGLYADGSNYDSGGWT